MLLPLEEERVSNDFLIKITSEVDLNFPRSLDVARVQIGELCPGVERGVSGPVYELVDAGTSCLETSWLLLTFNDSCLGEAFSDVIVFGGALYFAPETQVCRS